MTHFLRRTHNLLGLIVGAQVLLWVASGLFFALRPIEEVRGDHLRSGAQDVIASLPENLVPASAILAVSAEPALGMRLKPWLGRMVWEVETGAGKALYDAQTGEALSPATEENARRIAESGWAGDGVLEQIYWIDRAPREAGRGSGRAMWRAEFEGRDTATFWIDPQAGDIAAVRTEWWRAFDLFWGLHIMDWTSRETISSWWMKLFAFGALLLTVAGVWLVISRLMRGRLLR